MKKLLLFFAGIALALVACNDLEDRVDDLENRVGKLEELCKQSNTNIASLQQLVASLQQGNTIASVTPLVEDGRTVGYVIAFTKGDPVTIYHGREGKTPVIGVRQDEGGGWCWTVDGEWMMGPDGGKIRAEGRDATAPSLKIENGDWWVSTDGIHWTNLGKATGDDGDSFFRSVEQDDEKVTFTLADGTVIEIPKAVRLQITLSADECALTAGAPLEIDYTLAAANDRTRVEAIASGPVKARIVSPTVQGGKVSLLCDDPQAIDAYTRVVVLATDGLRSAVAAIAFEHGVLRVTDAIEVAVDGEQFSLSVETNLDYTVQIEPAAQAWLSQVETRAVRTDILSFKAESNDGAARSGLITLTAGSLVRTVSVAQKSGQVTFEIPVPTDFSTGNIQKAMHNGKQVAEICLEYIRSGETDAQLVVVYPMTDGKADLTRGFETSTGGTVVWDIDANTCVHTPGSAVAPLTKVYLETDGTLAAPTASTEPAATTLAADLLTDVRYNASETYRIVKIGTQYWMAENLRAENYTDGTAIPTEEWPSSTTMGAYVYLYSSAADNKSIFGALYNGYALQIEETSLAPLGWEIADNAAWTKLKNYIGSPYGTKLKSKDYWQTQKGSGVTGFDARPGLSYSPATGGFLDGTMDTWYWSNTPAMDFGQPALTYVRFTDKGTGMTFTPGMTLHGLPFGHYVRCVRK